MGKVIMAAGATEEEATAVMDSEVEVEGSQDPRVLIDKALHRAADVGDPIPTTMAVVAVVDKAPREATARDEAKVKGDHHLHKAARVPMLIGKETRPTDHRMEGSREVNRTKAAIRIKAKAKARTIRTVVRTGTRIKVTGDKANKTKARTVARTEGRASKIKGRTTRGRTIIRGRTTTTTKARTTTTITTTKGRTRVAIRDKDRHKTRGSFRTTTTTIITIIIMATTTSPSRKSPSRRPRSRPRRPNRPRPPPPKPSPQNSLLLRLPQHRNSRPWLLNHRRPWRRHHHLLQNKPQRLLL